MNNKGLIELIALHSPDLLDTIEQQYTGKTFGAEVHSLKLCSLHHPSDSLGVSEEECDYCILLNRYVGLLEQYNRRDNNIVHDVSGIKNSVLDVTQNDHDFGEVGGKVKITGNVSSHGFDINEIVKIVSVCHANNWWECRGVGGFWLVNFGDGELL